MPPSLAEPVQPVVTRLLSARVLFLCIVALEAAHTATAVVLHRVPGTHDGFQYFTLQYFFLNNAIQAHEVAQWIPYMTQGTVATLWYGIQGSFLQAVLLQLPALALGADLLSIYHLGMFVDEMILLTGTWLLARRFFDVPATCFIIDLGRRVRRLAGSALLELPPLLRGTAGARARTPLPGDRSMALGVLCRQPARAPDNRQPAVFHSADLVRRLRLLRVLCCDQSPARLEPAPVAAMGRTRRGGHRRRGVESGRRLYVRRSWNRPTRQLQRGPKRERNDEPLVLPLVWRLHRPLEVERPRPEDLPGDGHHVVRRDPPGAAPLVRTDRRRSAAPPSGPDGRDAASVHVVYADIEVRLLRLARDVVLPAHRPRVLAGEGAVLFRRRDWLRAPVRTGATREQEDDSNRCGPRRGRAHDRCVVGDDRRVFAGRHRPVCIEHYRRCGCAGAVRLRSGRTRAAAAIRSGMGTGGSGGRRASALAS